MSARGRFLEGILREFRRPFKREVTRPILMAENPDYAAYQIGRWSYGRPKIMQWGPISRLEIGSFCSIAADTCILLGGEHHTNFISTFPFGQFLDPNFADRHEWSRGAVVIGNDVWIGRGATIVSGVTIGDGAIVGAEALVNRDVNPYEIVVGNPAKHLRYRFNRSTVEALLDIAWWNWPDDEIRKEIPILMSGMVEEFIARHKKRNELLEKSKI